MFPDNVLIARQLLLAKLQAPLAEQHLLLLVEIPLEAALPGYILQKTVMDQLVRLLQAILRFPLPIPQRVGI